MCYPHLTQNYLARATVHIRSTRFASHRSERAKCLRGDRYVHHVSTYPEAACKLIIPPDRGNRLIFGEGLIATLGEHTEDLLNEACIYHSI